MPDPNDFVDEKTPEGEENVDPKAGLPGVGGMSTQEAEASYKNAAREHFTHTNDTKKQGEKKNSQRKRKMHRLSHRKLAAMMKTR